MRLVSRLLFLPVLAGIVACGDGIDLSTTAHAQSRGTFERTLTVDGPAELSVRTGSGDISIRTGEGGRVQIVGRITARSRLGESAPERIRQIEAAPPIEQTGNVVRIGDTRNDERYRD